LWIVGAAAVAVAMAMVGIGEVVDRPRSVLYDGIEPLNEGIGGVGRLKPRRLPPSHYRFTTLHGVVLEVERIGRWQAERGVVGWRSLKLHRDEAGVVERIDFFDGDGALTATETLRREGDTVFVHSVAGVEERDLDEAGRVKRIRVRDPEGRITSAASLVRDDEGRIVRRTQHLATGHVDYDAHYLYEDWRFPTRVTTETARGRACPVRQTEFDDLGRRTAVRCAGLDGTARVDDSTGCEEIRFHYDEAEWYPTCVVGETRTQGEPVPY